MANISESVFKGEDPTVRSSKRRKVFRRRPDKDEGISLDLPAAFNEAQQQQGAAAPGLGSYAQDVPDQPPSAYDRADEDVSVSAVEVLRRRKAAKARRGGIEFSNLHSSISNSGLPSEVMTLIAPTRSAVEKAASRFVPQTGQVRDQLDKHMMAYIDSEMAIIRAQPSSAPSLSTQSQAMRHEAARKAAADEVLQKQPASLGKLHEIDLGADATLRNIARTQAATRRLEGRESEDGEMEEQGRKVRLGRDGKPWRGRKRRTSEDVKRDKLVEEVLRESRLELYDESDMPQTTGEDQAADDRIAEEFRREFLDAVNSRNIRRTAPVPPGGASKGGKNEAPKGPKLGGSRSARAAMRALEEKAAKKK